MPSKPSPCLKRVEFPLNEQIFNTIGITALLNMAILAGLIMTANLNPVFSAMGDKHANGLSHYSVSHLGLLIQP
ncbi:hypothetical protein DIKCMJMK_02441 [Shewanella oneidensis]|uniref:hypothetical protein n=1 Tax=Shewanella oneidensis TaxID=70863 RepID=UPI00000E188E|nr:hypothetical protein [Shewanella oneidensis]MEE2028562.1 hypothetical protein [Shewanella oneidensis]